MSKYTKEIFVEKLKEYGYIYISGEYVNCKSILKCYDIEGYIVYISFDRLENHKSSKPQRFHKNNPNTEYNIMIYLQRHHECLCKYHSGKYVDAKSILDFECKCGNIFSTTFDNVRHFHKNKCDTCSGYNLNLSFNDVKNNLSRKGYFLTISEKDYKGITLSPLTCTDKDGYKYNVAYDSVMRDRKMETFSSSNPFVIDNINLYLQKHTKGEYKCISNKYIGAREPLEILHVKCNRIFQQSWMNISRKRYLDKLGDNKTGSQCPFL